MDTPASDPTLYTPEAFGLKANVHNQIARSAMYKYDRTAVPSPLILIGPPNKASRMKFPIAK